jgi:L-aminopeptidase/D-esterase-like protein
MPAGWGHIAGLKIAHAQDDRARTGCTVFLAEAGMVAACRVLGGAVGERELETMRRGHLAPGIHALVLAGGSAFGLDAAGGVMRWCERRGIGFDTGISRESSRPTIRVPIVPSAILFDLGVGETDPAFGPSPRPRHPDAEMGYAAAAAASMAGPGSGVAEGRVGVGAGCTVGKLFGLQQACDAGVGCWTEEIGGGIRVAALAAVNAFGDVRDPDTGRILAGARASEDSREFVDTAAKLRSGFTPRFGGANTVLVAAAANVPLTREEAQSLAQRAAPGMARVVSPAHTRLDGDLLFVLAPAPPDSSRRADLNDLGRAAAECVARAIARGVLPAR